MLFLGNRYKPYAHKVKKAADDYAGTSTALNKAIHNTIPSKFDGKSARKAAEIGEEIAKNLNSYSIRLEQLGNKIENIAAANDLD